MDKKLTYRSYIRRLLEHYAQPEEKDGQIETQIVIDEQNDHYLLLYVGWRGNERIRGCTLHLDIKDGRIWIQYDGTEVGVANDLVAMGVPKQDIVLGFRAPARRQYTEFAAA
jgi:hypothetical protein